MSYILEALKRAERERSLGKAPAATDVARMPTAATPEADRSRWLIRILIALLLLAIVVIIVLGRVVTSSKRNHEISSATNTTAPSNVGVRPAIPATGPKPGVADNAAINSLDDVAPVSQRDASEPPADYRVHRADSAPTQPPVAETPTEPAVATPSAADIDEARAADPVPVAPAMIPAQAPQEPIAAAAPAAATLPPQLRQMPDTFRAQFPALTVGVHAYDADPKRRFAIIDNHSYHEGDALPQGPRIESIVPEGIVFDWNGQRVLYAIQ